MPYTTITPAEAKPVAHYKMATRMEGGRLLYIAGQVARDAEGNVLGQGDIRTQARQVLENLRHVLQAAGGDLSDLFKMPTYITRIEGFPAVAEIRSRLFPGELPASTLIVVNRLAQPELRSDVEGRAAMGSRARRTSWREHPLHMQRASFYDEVGPMADLVFVGCSLAEAAAPLGPSGGTAPRRQVVLGGRRVRTVDIHAPCAVPAAMALMGLTVTPEILRLGPERLPQREAQGMDVEALSIHPSWDTAKRDLARQIITLQHETLAECCAAQPDRFVAFATVALPYPDLAAEPRDDGITRLGLRGVSVGGSVHGAEWSAPQFHPCWATAEARGVLGFLHPQGVPDLAMRFQGTGRLTRVIGHPLETTLALSHLMFEGTLDRFPGLKLCAAHGGGSLPSSGARSDHGGVTFPDRCSGPPLQKRPTAYVRDRSDDSLVFTAEALRHLVAAWGASQIMLGTDVPYPWTRTAVEPMLGTPRLSAAERAALLGETAGTLLPMAS
jgi:aminocarboxymuconate-semialdehyde decarboxylase